MVEGEAMKRYTNIIKCGNCPYTRGDSDWYTSKETKILYCTKDCYLAKEKGIDSWWNEDGTPKAGSLDSLLKSRTITVEWIG